MLWILSYVSPSNMHNTPSYTYICGMRPCSNLMPTLKMLSDPNGGPTSTHTRCSIALAVYYNAKRTGSTAWQFLRWNTRIVHALLCYRYSSTFRLYLRYSESLHGVTVATRWQYIVCVAALLVVSVFCFISSRMMKYSEIASLSWALCTSYEFTNNSPCCERRSGRWAVSLMKVLIFVRNNS